MTRILRNLKLPLCLLTTTSRLNQPQLCSIGIFRTSMIYATRRPHWMWMVSPCSFHFVLPLLLLEMRSRKIRNGKIWICFRFVLLLTRFFLLQPGYSKPLQTITNNIFFINKVRSDPANLSSKLWESFCNPSALCVNHSLPRQIAQPNHWPNQCQICSICSQSIRHSNQRHWM